MAGIAPAQLFPDFEIRIGPEAPQVRRELDGLVARREQLHQDGAPAVVHARGVGHPETFLQPHAQDGGVGALPVFDADAAAGRHGDVRRGEALDGLLLGIVQQGPEGGAEVDALELRDGGGAPHEGGQPLRSGGEDGLGGEVRQAELGVPGGDGGDAALEIPDIVREIQHRGAVFLRRFADGLREEVAHALGEGARVHQQAADAALALRRGRAGFAVPGHAVARADELREVGRIDGRSQEDPAHAAGAHAERSDGEPVAGGEGVAGIDGGQLAGRELETPGPFGPGFRDALRIGRRQQPADLERVVPVPILGVFGADRGPGKAVGAILGAFRRRPPSRQRPVLVSDLQDAAVAAAAARPAGGAERLQPGRQRGVVRIPRKGVFLFEQRGDIGRQRRFFRAGGAYQHLRDARMAGQRREPAPVGRDASRLVHGAQQLQQPRRLRQVRGRRRCEPREPLRVAFAPRRGVQHRIGQIGLQDLRDARRRHPGLGAGAPEPVADARRHAPGPPAPLVGHVAADPHRLQAAQRVLRVEDQPPAEAAVHHDPHPFDGERSLGDRRRQHDLAASGGARRNGRPLLLRRQHSI